MVEIIAEIGINHCGSRKLAKTLIEEAYTNGADVAKFQLYDTDIYHKPEFEWYSFCKHCELTKNDIIILKDYCDDIGIEFMVSVFNKKFISWTEDIGMKRYKIGSRCLLDLGLVNEIGKLGKDMIVSLGFWNKPEIPSIKTDGKVSYLYCISEYPTSVEKINWVELKKYDGFSDHTIGIDCAKKAIDLGVDIIEKHFTYDKRIFGPDQAGSMDLNDLKELVKYSK